MKAIQEAAGQDLQWVRLKWWKREFELRAGDEVLARLYKEKGTRGVIGEASDGRWVFRHGGAWKMEIVVLDAATQAEVAIIKRGRNAAIRFPDGRFLPWKRTSFWRIEWIWIGEDGNPLMRFQRGKRVVLEPLAFSLPDLSLLVIAGCHLMVLHQEEAAAASA